MMAIRDRVTRDGWVVVLLAIAAALSIYPVLTAVRWRVIGWPGDNIQYVYMTGRVAEALRNGQLPFSDPDLNYPGELWLPETDAPFLSMVMVAPLTLLFTPTLGYNAILFLSAFLTGVFTYLWIRKRTGSRFAGLVAGITFLLSPFRIVHSYGHLQVISTQFIPLFFWALDNCLTQAGLRRRHLAGLGAATFLVAASSQYYLFICAFGGLAYTLFGSPNARELLRRSWQMALAAGVGAAFGAAPFLATLLGDTAYTPYNVQDTRIWSASLFDFFLPSRLHPLWGSLVEPLHTRPTWIEHTLYLGAVPLALALLGPAWRNHPDARRNRVWLAVGLAGFVMALGTDLHLDGQPLSQEHPVWLPTYYFAQLPFANLMRAWSRFAVLPIFFVACLAGAGAARLQFRFGWSRLAMAICVGLLIIDLVPGRLTSITLKPRPIDHWLAMQPGRFAVGFLPPYNADYMTAYGSLLHDKQIPYTNHPEHIPAEYRQFMDAAQRFPDPASIRALQDMNLHYLIIDPVQQAIATSTEWSRVQDVLAHTPGVRIIGQVDSFVVVRIQPDP